MAWSMLEFSLPCSLRGSCDPAPLYRPACGSPGHTANDVLRAPLGLYVDTAHIFATDAQKKQNHARYKGYGHDQPGEPLRRLVGKKLGIERIEDVNRRHKRRESAEQG